MSTPIRLDDNLVREAELEGISHKRTPPKQIEYWAEIGKAVAHNLSSSDLFNLMQGFADIRIEARPSVNADPAEVFTALERDRQDGTLAQVVTQAKVWYEASKNNPGMLDRVQADGSRETGRFRNGEFVPGQ
jgi:hypothetical protein